MEKKGKIFSVILFIVFIISTFFTVQNNQVQGQSISSSSSGKFICQAVFSNCSCKKACFAFNEGGMIADCERSCSPEEISTYEPECMFVGANCVDLQGDECMCPQGKFFDGSQCIAGTLDCFNPVDSPICGCNSKTYQNSCLAKAAGIKKFTNDGCNFQSILNCKVDESCPLGICPNGKIYKRFTCNGESCIEITSSNDPCLSEVSSSGTGNSLEINNGFTGVWTTVSNKCLPLENPPLPSSGGCIHCPDIKVICNKPSVIVPQTCNSCSHCENCANTNIALALCVNNGMLEGIVNHSRYLDRSLLTVKEAESDKTVTLSLANPSFISPQVGIIDSPVDLNLILVNKKLLTGVFENMLYTEKITARKVKSPSCFSTKQDAQCCNGFISPSNDKVCPQGFLQSPCLLTNKFSLNVCCPITNSCSVPCGTMCCNKEETCVVLDPCLETMSICFAPASLICQNCTPNGSCANKKPCPDGTSCSNKPDFLCYPFGCPQLNKSSTSSNNETENISN